MYKLPQKKMILDGLLSGMFGLIGDAAQIADDKQARKKEMDYQLSRDAIEDSRYEDETAYNRAFAEDERSYARAEREYEKAFAENQRDYERALQQQIFEREDTAIERQANSLSKLGINPLSQNMSGLGVGQAVSAGGAPSSAVASSAPSASFHTGSKELNLRRLDLMTPILSLANAINNINTQGFQRDKLREEADYQRLKNQEQEIINERLANKLDSEQEAREEENKFNKENNPNKIKNEKASAERNQRENEFQERYGVQDNSDRYVRLATDTANQAQRATDYVEDKVGDLSKSATKTMVDNTKKAFQAYDRATRKIQDGIVSGFKKFGRKVNEFGNKYLGANY